LVNNYISDNAFDISSDYASIEDIFSVFSSDILDKFENEFLSYSRSIYEITNEDRVNIRPIDIDFNDKNSIYRNFQLTMMDLLSVPSIVNVNYDDITEKQNNFVLSTINTQIDLLGNKIKNIMDYDVIFKNGNPKNYNRYIYDSLSNHIGGSRPLTDGYVFSPYISNTLPTKNGVITLQQSINQNPLAWSELETSVGFSTITDLVYSNNGCFITDFFIDNNIAFTADNVRLLSQPIKIYATKKLNNPLYNSTLFNTDLGNYLSEMDSFLTNSLGITLGGLSAEVDQLEINALPTLNSAVDSKQSKIE